MLAGVLQHDGARNLVGKTAFISGGSRGIGLAIALRLAEAGANLILAAKSVEEDPRLGGTIYSAAEAVEQAGGKALPVVCDIRYEDQIQHAVAQGAKHFGGIDFLINNASAIALFDTPNTASRRLDLMIQINLRGTFLVTQTALPFLTQSGAAHILTMSPPINLNTRWLAPHVAYTISKYSMSMMTMGWAEEFKELGIAANSLWPATTIATAAVQNLLGGEHLIQRSRKPAIVADAAYFMLCQDPQTYTGLLLTDEQVLHQAGVTNFDTYAVAPGGRLQEDLFL